MARIGSWPMPSPSRTPKSQTFSVQPARGTLSRALANLTTRQQDKVMAEVEELPENIGLLSLRKLVPLMSSIDVGRPLNLLTAEAVAAALVLDATIVVTTESALLRNACAQLGVALREVA
jgi:hypothetical protein